MYKGVLAIGRAGWIVALNTQNKSFTLFIALPKEWIKSSEFSTFHPFVLTSHFFNFLNFRSFYMRFPLARMSLHLSCVSSDIFVFQQGCSFYILYVNVLFSLLINIIFARISIGLVSLRKWAPTRNGLLTTASCSVHSVIVSYLASYFHSHS